MSEKVKMKNLLKYCILFIVLAFGWVQQCLAYELLASWNQGQFSAVLAADNSSKSVKKVRLASPYEYNFYGVEVPVFFSQIELALDPQRQDKLYININSVKNPSKFSLVFLELFNGQTLPLVYDVTISSFGVLIGTQSLEKFHSVNAARPSRLDSTKTASHRVTNTQKSTEFKNLLDELDASEYGSLAKEPSLPKSTEASELWAAPALKHSMRVAGSAQEVSNGVDDQETLLVTGANIGEGHIKRQNIDKSENTALQTTASQYASGSLSPDFILSSGYMSAEIGHYKTVFTIASFFVFFLALSVLFLMIVKFVREDRSAMVATNAPAKEELFVNKAFELQAAQIAQMIELLGKTHRQSDVTLEQKGMSSEGISPKQYDANSLSSTQLEGKTANKANLASSRTTTTNNDKNLKQSGSSENLHPNKLKLSDTKDGKLKNRGSQSEVEHALAARRNDNTSLPARLAADAKPDRMQSENQKQSESREGSTTRSIKETKSEKLDLISVYRDMGDFQMARSMARELVRNGTDIEKLAAQKILDELK